MSYLVWAVVGLLVGALAGSAMHSMLSAVIGVVFGLWWARMSGLRRDLDATRRQLAEMSAQGIAPQATATPPPTVSDESPKVAEWSAPEPAIAARVAEPVAVTPPPVEPSSIPPAQPPRIPEPPRQPPPPNAIELGFGRIKGWFFEGNVPVKIGMLVLFAGVAAALKYAADAGFLHISPSLRVGGIALAAIAALAFGWRQRDNRRIFGLSLQGGAIGVLVMTVFAAFRLYGLISSPAAFALLIVLVAGIGVLAVVQDALALAVLGLVAGFAAPILISTGSGSHVALFTYYALLNLAILGIAWKRSWRVLNLLGFIATFGIGTAWGVLKYEPELFASTEPFLILNFLFYLAIPLLHLLRSPDAKRAVMDACLLFGTPLISLLLQGALLHWEGTPLAISALVAAVVYLIVAWSIRNRPGMHLLRDAWAVLAVAFATLAVPLAISANLTGCVFALEGAGMIWLGLRQRRRLPRWSGLALQLFAGLALYLSIDKHSGTGIDVGDFVGALLIAGAAMVSCWLYGRFGSGAPKQRIAAAALFLWGIGWWLFGSASEIDALLRYTDHSPAAYYALFALTAWLLAEVARRRPRFEIAPLTAFFVPFLFAIGALVIFSVYHSMHQPLAGWMLAAVVFSAIVGWRSLRCLVEYPLAAAIAQFVWLWRWVIVFATAIVVVFAHSRWMAESWPLLLASLPFLVLWVLAFTRPRWVSAPLEERWSLLRAPLLYSLVAVGLVIFVYALFAEGDAAPLRFVPILNPVELLMLLIAMVAVRWLGDAGTPIEVRRLRPLLLGIAGMAFATSATLRAVHHLAGVPYTAMYASSVAQMSLTVVWSVLGVFAWVWGSRRGQRTLWLAGALTMGVVLAKLLLVDRGHLGNLFGIGSFIAYGLLCTAIGYFAPAPPRSPSSSGVIADAS